MSEPTPDYAAIAPAGGAYGEGVSEPGQMEPASRRAIAAVEQGRRALLDVRREPGGWNGRRFAAAWPDHAVAVLVEVEELGCEREAAGMPLAATVHDPDPHRLIRSVSAPTPFHGPEGRSAMAGGQTTVNPPSSLRSYRRPRIEPKRRWHRRSECL